MFPRRFHLGRCATALEQCYLALFVIGPVCACVTGCQLLPPNYLRLVTAERAGPHPRLLNFTRGLAVEEAEGGRGVTLLAGRNVVVLFDHRGRTNRVQLVFCKDGNRVLYERIGQRTAPPEMPADLRPVGVKTKPSGRELRGSIDVFLAITERADVDLSALYEHYPRVIRLVGYWAVPVRSPEQPELAFALTPPEDGRALVAWLAELARPENDLLPRLPALDVKYLVPTTLVDRLADQF